MNPNNKGYIRATTISSEKFIIIGSENIELSGNVIMKNDVTLSSGLFNTNSIVPNITNSKSLGTSTKIWSNAYIHDLSINNNIEISGNTIINGVLQAPNIYTNALQVSGNATISGSTLYVPSSFTIDPNGHGDNTGTLLINGNLVVQGVTTTINSSVVDISDKMIILASNASNSFEANGAGFEISGAKVNFLYNNSSTTFNSSIGISISGNVVPLTNSVGSLGESGKIWDIAYIRELNVTNFTNSIDGAKIANETITSTQIMNGSILGTDISNDTITSANIRDGSILTADICDNAITFNKLAYNSVGNTRIINGAVTHEKLSSDCIQSHNIVDGTIVDDDISGNANILGSKLANNSITSDKINQANNWTFSQLTTTRANIRDISTTNIEVSGNIMPLRDNSSNLGSSLNRWNYIYVNDLSVNTINGQAYSAGGGGGGGGGSTVLTSITSNIIPSTTNTYNLGSTTSYWSNAYINNLKVSNRVYQEISNNSNWNAVNGHYGLMKTSYPALNPITIMESMTWTRRTHVPFHSALPARRWADVCWSPKLRLFVAVNVTNNPNAGVYGNIGYSQDGINWNYIYANTNWNHRSLYSVCWSDELGIFVACGLYSIIMYSADGINWSESNAINWNSTRNPEGGNIDGYDICWSPQLRLFVIIDKETSEGDKIIVSSNGIDWTSVGINYTNGWIRTNLTCICWSPELGIFVALDGYWRGGDKPIASVLTSSDGFNWNITIISQQYSTWETVCWSPQLGLFAACSTVEYAAPQLMTSRNGVDWTIIDRSVNDAPFAGDWSDIIWCAELGFFVVSSNQAYWVGGGPYLVSSNGIDWITRDNYEYLASDGLSMTLHSMCWCPHLGIIVGVGGGSEVSARGGGGNGGGQIWTTSLKIRPPTISNVFDSSFNRIDENGKWTFSAVDVSGALNVMGTVSAPNLYTKTEVDVSFVSKELFDASINALASGGGGGGGGGGSTDLTSITSNIIPSTTNTYNLGSTTSYWSNAYINNLKVSNRVYQEISGGINDPSWAAVNGYYALAKDAYPALNPLSSGVNAVMNWSFFLTQFNPICDAQDINSICWSPELRIFVAVASSWQPTRIMTSINGTIWIPRTTPVNLIMMGVCWSSELLIFVAVSYNTNIVLTSINGTTWIQTTAHTGNWTGICWSPQLGLFVAVAPDGVNNIMTSTDGINWLLGTIQDTSWLTNDWFARICWSAELGMFAIVNTANAAVLTSTNGINWTVRTIDNLSVWGGLDICWSKELGIFVAVGLENKGIISNNGINWRVTEINLGYDVTRAVVWSPQLKIFIAFAWMGSRLLISNDGINWTERFISNETYHQASCWSPELGIFVVGGTRGFLYSSLKGRPPTSYNVFDSSFNSIDETGKWSFQNLGVTGTFTNTSDDRLKHNEVVISNGLAIIDSLTPKFYQKTLTMLDASYNGDLSGQAWTYEAGIIAQELLQISDLSFVVSGGNYYQERYIYSRPTNGPSNANYDPSFNIYDISNANYTISNDLITQAYNVNYNSVFVYGLAAIKELHTKVKAQEASISTLQTSMLEQQATINSLLTRLQALETSAN